MTFRAFISLDIGPLPRVVAFARALRESGGQLSLVNPEILHTTLKFLGDIGEDLVPKISQGMERAADGEHAFTATLRGTGVFPNAKRMRVVWVGMEGVEPLTRIAEALEKEMEALGFLREGRPWRPHITVARVRGPRNQDRVWEAVDAFAKETFGEVRADRIRLKKSVLTPQGPQYSTVAEAPLAP